MEIWKKIQGLPEHYEASSAGRIRRLPYYYTGVSRFGNKEQRLLPEKIYLLTKVSPKGYQRINLESKVWFVHRLIAQTFVPNPNQKQQVNHLNGIKTDNAAANLEWVSNQENRNHAVKTGLQPIGERVSKKLTDGDIISIRALADGGMPQKAIAQRFDICQQNVSHIVRRSTWKHITDKTHAAHS